MPMSEPPSQDRLGAGWRRTRSFARSTGHGFATGARAGAKTGRSVDRFWHKITGASGASRTGLAALIELTAIGGAGDAFVAVALAGTIFFSTSVTEARGRVVLFLLVTMAPFAVLAPFIGPVLDRMQQGRRYLLAGTLLARGLLCWGMSAAVNDAWTLLPMAFGVLVLQKAYGVARAAVTPRLLPAEITLVAANARSQLISLSTAFVAAPVAELIQIWGGAAWALRVGTLVYFGAVLIAIRLPEHVDTPAVPAPLVPTAAAGGPAPGAAADSGGGGPGETADARAAEGHRNGGRWRTLRNVGPVVAEAMEGNAVLRFFSGYTLFFLAFVLRTGHFGVSHNLALGAMVGGVSAGSLVAMGIGSMMRARAPYVILFTMLALAPLAAAACAYFFGLIAAVLVAFTATCCAGLGKLAQDSIVQREIGEEIRSSTFAVSETLNQVSNVAGALAGVLVSMLNNGQVGLAIPAAFMAAAVCWLMVRRRRRVHRAAR
jgi:MFS family permease